MAFQKGISGNQHGKVPGTLNKKTIAHHNLAQAWLEEIANQSSIAEMVSAMSLKERAALAVNLMEFTQPRLARTAHTDGDGGPIILTVLTSPKPVMLPMQPQAEQIAYTEVKSLPEGAKPF